MFTVIWLIVFIVGLPVEILTLYSFDFGSQTLFIAFMLYTILSHISSIVAVVWVSVIKRRKLLEILENISEVDNKIRYTTQEETYMNRNVMFNINSEMILLTVIQCIAIIYNIYHTASEPFFIYVILTISSIPDTCYILILFQFLSLVFMVKQWYSHLKNRFTNSISGTFSRPICLNKENERRSQFSRAVHNVIVTPLRVSSVGNIEGTLRQTDIHSLRQIYTVSCGT